MFNKAFINIQEYSYLNGTYYLFEYKHVVAKTEPFKLITNFAY